MEILNTYTELGWSLWIIGAPGIFLTIPALFFTIKHFSNRENNLALSWLIIVLLCIIDFRAYMLINDAGVGSITYHEVVVNDESQIDTSKYDIIEKKGKIYVIRERAE